MSCFDGDTATLNRFTHILSGHTCSERYDDDKLLE